MAKEEWLVGWREIGKYIKNLPELLIHMHAMECPFSVTLGAAYGEAINDRRLHRRAIGMKD